MYQPDSPAALEAVITAVLPRRVALVGKVSGIKDQPDSIKSSLALFLREKPERSVASASGRAAAYFPTQRAPSDAVSSFDYLIISRYDVRLLSPIATWPCYERPQQIGLASKCEPAAWARFNCVADHFWLVPRTFIRPLNSLIGTRLNLSHFTKCCFSKRCIQKAGHGCHNVLGHHLGAASLGFCWPQPQKSVAEPNPHYQCCAHGRAAVTMQATQAAAAPVQPEPPPVSATGEPAGLPPPVFPWGGHSK